MAKVLEPLFLSLLERMEAHTGQRPDALIADAGDTSATNLEACVEKGLAA